MDNSTLYEKFATNTDIIISGAKYQMIHPAGNSHFTRVRQGKISALPMVALQMVALQMVALQMVALQMTTLRTVSDSKSQYHHILHHIYGFRAQQILPLACFSLLLA
ncbi:MAG: hypothetical protein OXC46_05235 [Thaumarchaeota archaeon]|nr:hypothetical protein [Nitrososphaerota archaeon]